MKNAFILIALLGSTSFLFAGQDKAEPAKAEPAKPAAAEPVKNPVTTAVKDILARQQKNLIAAVEEMPADKFSFKPTPEQIPFSHLVEHISGSNIELCSKAGSMPPPPMHSGPDMSKEMLMGMLTRSFAYCEAALNRLDDSKLGNSIEIFGGRQVTVAYALIALTNDWADHYSAAASYLRLNGLLPPTAQAKK
jgi:hypothetical protein